MERAAWTEERLDDLATNMREGFARVDNDIRDLRGEIGALRAEMNEGFKDLRNGINDLRLVMFRVGGGMLATMCIGFLSVLAAILARGA
jgi:hypothetical protein